MSVAPLAERRNVDVEHVQPIVEVGAELAPCHRIVQVPVGRRDHAHVGPHRARAAQAHELALLQHAQELRLRGGRHLGDFVEKQHAARRQLNLTGLGLLRAGEGAALESEQLRFEQLLRQGRAVDRDERTAAPRRAAVDEPGHDFLAGPRLALQAGRRFGGGDARGALQHVAPRGRCAEHALPARRRRRSARCGRSACEH